MSNFSSDSPKQLGCSPVPLVPPNEQMASLTVDDNKTSNRPKSPDSRFTIQTSKFSADSSKPHGCSSVPVAPPTEQLTSLAVDDKTSNANNSTDSNDATSPTFFQLLETVSPHLQSVLLNKCNVLELSCLAAVSSSLRKGALATMANRSLVILFITNYGDNPVLGELFLNETMHIEDRSDPSRNVIIEIGKEYPCFSWRKIQKLLYFCGHAIVKGIAYHIDPFVRTKCDAVRDGHSTRTEWSLDEFFVDGFRSYTYDCFDMLKFVSPHIVKLIFANYELRCDNVITRARLHSVFHSRGMRSADWISVDFDNPMMSYAVITDELMLILPASSITFSMLDEIFPFTVTKFISWSPVGVSLFIEQWLRGSRIIKRVQTCLPMVGDPSVPPTDQEPVEFGKNLVEALGKLKQSPKIHFSTSLNDDLKSQMQILDGKPIYNPGIGFCSEASVIRVTDIDGRQLTIVVSKARDNNNNISIEGGFIDIFPSS